MADGATARLVQSMTGFATAAEPQSGRWTWEVRSVNGKGLDIRYRGPAGLERIEPAVRERVSARFKRGSVQLSLSLSAETTGATIKVNHGALAELVETARALRGEGDSTPVDIEQLMTVRGVVELAAGPTAIDEAAEARILSSLDTALAALAAMRSSEGEMIADVLTARLAEIEALTKKAEANDARSPDAIRDRLTEQMSALNDAATTLDPDRLHQEAMLLATRADIDEELDRLKAHIAAARKLISGGGAIGRRLDFLAQEFNRETNTLCAKSNHHSLTAIGLDLKAVVDQFREQVQNLE